MSYTTEESIPGMNFRLGINKTRSTDFVNENNFQKDFSILIKNMNLSVLGIG